MTEILTPSADPSNPDNTPSTPLASNQDATPVPPQPAPVPVQPQPAQAAQPSTPALASNAPAQVPLAQAHPVASRIADVAQILAGSPRYNTVIDANGNTTRTPVPVSKSHIGMAIALEALSGSLAGLGARGTNATGQAAASGLAQGQQIAQQRNQAQQYQDQQAQQDAKNRSDAIVRAASNLEINSRTSINTSQSERMGVESLKDAVSQNADLLQNYQDQGQVQEEHVSQDALMAGMQGKDPKYSALNQLAIPDGFTNINGRYEQTFAIVQNPNAKVTLSPEQARAFGDAGVQGFLPYADGKAVLGIDAQVPGTVVARANAQLHANNLMLQDAQSVQTALSNSKDPATQELAKSIPDFKSLEKDPNNGPVFQSALLKLQRYVSHSQQHGMSLAESLQQMAQPSIPDPNNKGKFIPNPDAGAAQVIYGAFGNGDPNKGKAILQAYHDETAPTPIKDLNEANSILADQTSTARERLAANTFIKNTQQQKVSTAGATAGAEARAKKAVEGTGTGINPADAPLVAEIVSGKMPPDRLGYLMARNPKLLVEVAQSDPSFDASKVEAYPKVYTDFTSGKTSGALNAGGTALVHLNELKALNTDASHIPGTSAYTAYKNKVDTVSTELARFYGDVTVPAIASIKSTLMSTLPGNRQAAIETQAKSMGDKLDSYEQTWQNAAPSKAYEAPMPGISQKAIQARQNLDPDYKPTAQSGQQAPPVQKVVPAGATPGRDAKGNIIGYRTAAGQVVRFAQ